MPRLLLAFLLGFAYTAAGQVTFTLSGTVPELGAHALDVNNKGPFPASLSGYLATAAWRVWVTKPGSTTAVELSVDSVTFADQGHRKFRLGLSGALPSDTDFSKSTWSVLFDPDRKSGIVGTALTYNPSPGQHGSPATNCDPATANLYFCVPASGAVPDISFSGTFTAAGGTKPLYQFELLAGLYTERSWLGLRPGFTTKTEVNQNASPPINRTRFDPDSITASLAFQGLKSFKDHHHPLDLYGIQFDETLPGGEFARKDQTSNVIIGSSAQFILRSFTRDGHRTYGTLYPLIGMEAGHNLNKPRQLDGVAADLSHYNSVLRGIGGATASFARKSPDKTVDVWSVAGSYVVRIPATDEPLVQTIHQVTTVQVTTRARHWIEVDASASPWSFKYFAITGKYQYGDLPPAFNFVNHSLSIGLTLNACQSNKPNAAGAPLASH